MSEPDFLRVLRKCPPQEYTEAIVKIGEDTESGRNTLISLDAIITTLEKTYIVARRSVKISDTPKEAKEGKKSNLSKKEGNKKGDYVFAATKNRKKMTINQKYTVFTARKKGNRRRRDTSPLKDEIDAIRK